MTGQYPSVVSQNLVFCFETKTFSLPNKIKVHVHKMIVKLKEKEPSVEWTLDPSKRQKRGWRCEK